MGRSALCRLPYRRIGIEIISFGLFRVTDNVGLFKCDINLFSLVMSHILMKAQSYVQNTRP